MNVVIRDIDNSKGIIITAHALKEAGIGSEANLRIEKNCITVQTSAHPRAGWFEAIQKDPTMNNDPVLMDGLDQIRVTSKKRRHKADGRVGPKTQDDILECLNHMFMR
jgi:antitoxin component of MazEF toxin-antitoxin module